MKFLKSKLTYKEILEEWMNDKKDIVKEQSYIKYINLINKHINPILGNYNYKNLNNKDVEKFFQHSNIRDLSPSTKKTLVYIVKNSINYGVLKNIRKPIENIDLKIKKPKAKVVYLTKYEQETLEKYLGDKNDVRALGIFLCLYTGIRLGEVCGLKWEDVDFVNKSITINRTVQRIKNTDKNNGNKTKKIVSTPKSETSKRTIPLPEFLYSMMLKYQSNDNHYILTDSEDFKDTRVFEKYLENTLKKCYIRNLNFHTLRHTFATRSIESGMDIKTLSEILGHASYHITLDIYVHSTIDQKRDCINNLVSYLNNS